jgi:hypothetical protein
MTALLLKVQRLVQPCVSVLPDRALVTDGAALQVQDDNEQFTTLTVANQKHIGVNFTTAELTMQLG